MSGYISGAVWNTRFPDKPSKFILASIADNANDEGFAWPSVELIQRRTQYSRRSVLAALEQLESDGWIVKMQSPRSFRHNAYQIVLDKLNFEKPPVPELTLKKRKSQVQSTTYQVQSTTPDKTESGAICAESGAIYDTSQVQSTTESGAIYDTLYRGTVNEPSLEPSGGIVSETAPPGSDSKTAPGELAKLAAEMFQALSIVTLPRTLILAAEAIRLQSQSLKIAPRQSMLQIKRQAESAQARGEAVNHFWFEDSKWKSTSSPAAVGMYCGVANAEVEESEPVPEGADTELGKRVWDGMQKAIKSAINVGSFETWVRPIKQRGVLDCELFLEIPCVEFGHVADQYGFSDYLPQSITTLHILTRHERAGLRCQ